MLKATLTVAISVLASSLMLTESARAGSTTFIFEGTTYLNILDSPMYPQADDLYFEGFEDRLINTPRITIDGGIMLDLSRFTDSVAANIGVIDSFTFNIEVGTLVDVTEEASFAWTDGNTADVIRIEAIVLDGVSIFDIVLGNENHLGTTVEDLFLGVQNEGGISSIKLATTFRGIVSDHLQFASIIPLVAPIALGLAGLSGVLFAKRLKMHTKN